MEADITSYNILLKACCNTRRADLALKIYEELKATNGRGSLKLDAYTYSSMIKVVLFSRILLFWLKSSYDRKCFC